MVAQADHRHRDDVTSREPSELCCRLVLCRCLGQHQVGGGSDPRRHSCSHEVVQRGIAHLGEHLGAIFCANAKVSEQERGLRVDKRKVVMWEAP